MKFPEVVFHVLGTAWVFIALFGAIIVCFVYPALRDKIKFPEVFLKMLLAVWGCTVFFGGLAFVIAYSLYDFFGWSGLVIGAACAFVIIIFTQQRSKKKQREEEYKRRFAPCSHGTAGAVYGFTTCSQCEQERIVKEQAAKRKAEQEAAQIRAAEEQAYREWVAKIRLPEYLLKMHPEEFERLVCTLFERMGFDVEHTQYSGDGGIDGYLKKDGQLSVLQCKRVKGSVGQPVLRDLFGTMHAVGAKEGVVVTTGKVSTQARAWLQGKPIRIYELDELTACIRTYFKEDDVVPTAFTPNTRAKGIPKDSVQVRRRRKAG
jgi:HJR/Mrr/RecB family endonuclease